MRLPAGGWEAVKNKKKKKKHCFYLLKHLTQEVQNMRVHVTLSKMSSSNLLYLCVVSTLRER